VRPPARAIRCIGHLIDPRRQAGLLAKGAKASGGPGRGKRGAKKNPRFPEPPTLASEGVDKNLDKKARKASAMSEA
jgi:hypothetical protein